MMSLRPEACGHHPPASPGGVQEDRPLQGGCRRRGLSRGLFTLQEDGGKQLWQKPASTPQRHISTQAKGWGGQFFCPDQYCPGDGGIYCGREGRTLAAPPSSQSPVNTQQSSRVPDCFIPTDIEGSGIIKACVASFRSSSCSTAGLLMESADSCVSPSHLQLKLASHTPLARRMCVSCTSQ